MSRGTLLIALLVTSLGSLTVQGERFNHRYPPPQEAPTYPTGGPCPQGLNPTDSSGMVCCTPCQNGLKDCGYNVRPWKADSAPRECRE